ncbi:hypothetical protein [Nocardia alni]|uniref:hypothetical protein n=1 Tax=Nocardia alni TaxID=2815723 RepID=UPI0020B33113|nr:hypothetical protein [Nocardia alni]
MTESLPATAVVRVSRATFDQSRFAEVDALNSKQAAYLVPAIEQLPGLLHFYSGDSPDGSIMQISIWDTDEHAAQLNGLKEMVVIARGEAEAIGVTFTPIVHHPINWIIGNESAESLPSTAVIRVSRGSFDPSWFDEVDALASKQAEFLVPAIEQLPGLVHWYAAVSPKGSIVNLSVWDSDEHATQMETLKEMVVTARGQFEALGAVTFAPIINYPINWTI